MNTPRTVVLILIMFNFSAKVFAAEGSTYSFSWLDPDKEVYVLQNRKFRKKGRPYASLGAGMTTSGAFINSNNIQLRGGFFFTEQWGLELLYSKNFGGENDTYESVKALGKIPFYREIDSYFGGMVQWAPFYAKVNTFNFVMYFDWVFGLGGVSVNESNNIEEFTQTGTNMKSESHFGFAWNTHLLWYFTKMIGVRMDLTGFHYRAEAPGASSTTQGILTGENTWNDNFDLTVSLNVTF